jgi:hypothetical protein
MGKWWVLLAGLIWRTNPWTENPCPRCFFSRVPTWVLCQRPAMSKTKKTPRMGMMLPAKIGTWQQTIWEMDASWLLHKMINVGRHVWSLLLTETMNSWMTCAGLLVGKTHGHTWLGLFWGFNGWCIRFLMELNTTRICNTYLYILSIYLSILLQLCTSNEIPVHFGSDLGVALPRPNQTWQAGKWPIRRHFQWRLRRETVWNNMETIWPQLHHISWWMAMNWEYYLHIYLHNIWIFHDIPIRNIHLKHT